MTNICDRTAHLWGIIAVASIFFCSCKDQTLSTNAGHESVQAIQAEWGESKEGFQLSARTSKNRYSPSEDVDLVLVLKNVVEDDLRIWSRGLLGTYRLEIKGPTKEDATLTARGKQQIEAFSESSRSTGWLKPSESRTDSLPALNQLYDMSLPGEYTIVARRPLWKRDNPDEHFELASNPLVVTITDH